MNRVIVYRFGKPEKIVKPNTPFLYKGYLEHAKEEGKFLFTTTSRISLKYPVDKIVFVSMDKTTCFEMDVDLEGEVKDDKPVTREELLGLALPEDKLPVTDYRLPQDELTRVLSGKGPGILFGNRWFAVSGEAVEKEFNPGMYYLEKDPTQDVYDSFGKNQNPFRIVTEL